MGFSQASHPRLPPRLCVDPTTVPSVGRPTRSRARLQWWQPFGLPRGRFQLGEHGFQRVEPRRQRIPRFVESLPQVLGERGGFVIG